VAGGGTLRLSGIADLAGFSVDIAGDTSELITANEITNITGADIKVVDGARFGDGVSQTQLGTFTSPDGTSTRLEADGAGSEIVLPTITHLVRDASFGPGASDGGGLVLACDGGLIDLSSLEQIEGAIGPSRELRFEASDATIDLRSLGPIVDGSVAFETRENASLIAGSLVGDIELRISGGLLDVRGDIRPTNPARIVFLENTVKIGGDLEYAAGVSSRVTENTDIGFVGGTVQYLEVAGEDRGVVNPTAFDENFQFKTITVGDGTERSTLVLRDRIDHGNGGAQAEALYILRNPLSPDDPPVFDGQSLFIESGSTLRLNGISTYAVLDGEVAGQVYDNELVKLNDLVPPGQTSIAFGDGLLSTEGRCLGDATSDNTVGLNDLLIVLAAFGDSIENGAAGGDLDNSGKIDLDDLLEVLANFGASCL
jgi:hypothetical protein